MGKPAILVDSLRDLINEPELAWLAGQESLLLGRKYFSEGRVSISQGGSVWVDATISNGQDFTFELAVLSDGDLQYSCNCDSGIKEIFCAHCVAAALSWLVQNYDQTEGDSDGRENGEYVVEPGNDFSDFVVTLEKMDRTSLISLLLDCVQRDPLLLVRARSFQDSCDLSENSPPVMAEHNRQKIDELFSSYFYVPFDRDEVQVAPDELYFGIVKVFKGLVGSSAVSELAYYCLEQIDEVMINYCQEVQDCCDSKQWQKLKQTIRLLEKMYFSSNQTDQLKKHFPELMKTFS